MDRLSYLLTETAQAVVQSSPAGSRPADAAAGVIEALASPLRVGVVGRVSAGKSTLVNALLERDIAPTAAGECTRIPAWFRYGRLESASLQQPGLPPIPLALSEGRLPSRLPAPAESHSRIEVRLTVPLLEGFTLVDTPGLASASDGVSERTAALMSGATSDAAGQVDALVVVLTGPLHVDELAAISALTEQSPSSGSIAVAALTLVDLLDPDPDTSWRLGTELAGEILQDHSSIFSDVVPVAGLLAQAGAITSLDERDARTIVSIAAAIDPALQPIVLADARTLQGWDLPVDAEHLRRLVEILGLYGLARLMDHARATPGANASTMTDYCLHESGRAALLASVESNLAARADLLRAVRAAAVLRQLAADPDVAAPTRRQIETDLAGPELFRLRVHDSLVALTHSRTPLPPRLAEQARSARDGTLQSMSPSEAAREVAAWRQWAMLADGFGRQAAEAVITSLHLATRS